MDAVSIETKAESNWINRVIQTNRIDYIWTGIKSMMIGHSGYYKKRKNVYAFLTLPQFNLR